MSKDYSLEFLEDHVRVVLSHGYEVSSENRRAFWADLKNACEEHDTRRVLVEGDIPTEERDIDEVIDAGTSAAAVPHLWLAFSVPDWEPTEQTELFEAMARIGGVRVKFFSDSEHALNWLRLNAPK
ncbi:MAG TPA: hypothetical protein VMM38_01145 [Aridibacter sp.]|nr:hypothetical protein [Aridibacter sp.]